MVEAKLFARILQRIWWWFYQDSSRRCFAWYSKNLDKTCDHGKNNFNYIIIVKKIFWESFLRIFQRFSQGTLSSLSGVTTETNNSLLSLISFQKGVSLQCLSIVWQKSTCAVATRDEAQNRLKVQLRVYVILQPIKWLSKHVPLENILKVLSWRWKGKEVWWLLSLI